MEESDNCSQIASNTDSSSESSSSITNASLQNMESIQHLPFREGNKKYGFRMHLYCRTGFTLVILPDGTVKGLDEGFEKYGVMEFSSAGVSEVRIRGEETNLYLAMNKKGRLYGEPNVDEEGTIFVENFLGQYNTYLSRKFAHLGWYVGIKKSGKSKPAERTAYGQKAIQFLPRRLEE